MPLFVFLIFWGCSYDKTHYGQLVLPLPQVPIKLLGQFLVSIHWKAVYQQAVRSYGCAQLLYKTELRKLVEDSYIRTMLWYSRPTRAVEQPIAATWTVLDKPTMDGMFSRVNTP